MALRIAIRADASQEMGSGHLMRCLTLANELKSRRASVTFLLRKSAGPLVDSIRENGHAVQILPDNPAKTAVDFSETAYARWLPVTMARDAEQSACVLASLGDIDWLIVDHYALDERWQSVQRRHAKRICVIDDLANRRHDCDLLLDQNLVEGMKTRYDGLVPRDCRKLLGPNYALLRSEFAEARRTLRQRDGTIRRILIFFGGTDPTNQTGKALDALAVLGRRDIAVDVVLGPMNPHIEAVRAQVLAMPNVTLRVQVSNMAELMAAADLAIGAGGTATWERCCVGLPAIAIAVAENQRATVDRLNTALVQFGLGHASAVSTEQLSLTINLLSLVPTWLVGMSEAARQFVDGGGSRRVATILASHALPLSMRVADYQDSALLLEWRNHPDVRSSSHTKHEISLTEHTAWLTRVLADPNQTVLIAEVEGRAVGVVRFTVQETVANISITVAPTQQNAGLGEQMLRITESWIERLRPQIERLDAEILPTNAASHRVFNAAGYKHAYSTYVRFIRG